MTLHTIWKISFYCFTVKPVENGPSQKDQKLVFSTNYRLMQVKSIAECSKGHSAILSTALSYHLQLRSLICLSLSGRFTQVLLYINFIQTYLSARKPWIIRMIICVISCDKLAQIFYIVLLCLLFKIKKNL